MKILKTTKRGTFYVILFLALLAALAPGPAQAESWLDVADTSWYDEAQTEFTISTEAQLAGLAKLIGERKFFEGKTVRLDRDLDLTTREWTSPGPSNNGFRGTFDGRGHCIELNAPLFNTVGTFQQPATFLNLNLSGDIVLSYTGQGQKIRAPLANNCRGTIRNCSFTGSLVLENTESASLKLGGLVGDLLSTQKTQEISK